MITSVSQCAIAVCTCCLLMAHAAPSTRVETHSIKKHFFENFGSFDFDSILNHILQTHNQNQEPINNFGQTITGPRWKRDVNQSASDIHKERSNSANTKSKRMLAKLLQNFLAAKVSNNGRKTRSSLYHILMAKAQEHLQKYGIYPSLGGLALDGKNGPSWLGGYGRK